MTKTKKIYKNNKGGRVIASGGYGCVFNPVLKCKGSSKRDSNKISKLMTTRHAKQEFEEINKIRKKLDSIPNYKDYFLIYDATLCSPAKLTSKDLQSYSEKCTALPKDNITKDNINSKLDEVMSLNIPNGGLPVDDYIYKDGTFKKLYEIHVKLMKLLKNGIIPMNERHIYHCDIKDSNILIDDSMSELKPRLIDWGLSVEYVPGKTIQFPKNWRNRPLQFNVPFSVIIFTDDFYNKYTVYLREGGQTNELHLKPFIIDYFKYWTKERGAGHYKFINEIIFMLFSKDLTSVSEKDKALIIETEFTIPIIIDYIVDSLAHHTKFKSDGSLNLREYLDKVFIKIVDVWGFINVYYPILELLYNNYSTLNKNEMKVFKQIKFLFNEYLYKPRHEPINMTELFNDLKILGELFHSVSINDEQREKKKTQTISKKNTTRRASISSSSLFKRKKLAKKFNKPFLLSVK